MEISSVTSVKIRTSRANCCVVGCRNTYSNTSTGTVFYSFPNKMFPGRKEKWLAAIRRITAEGMPWLPSKNSRVCSVHFVGGKKSDHPDSPAFVPSMMPDVYRVKQIKNLQRRGQTSMPARSQGRLLSSCLRGRCSMKKISSVKSPKLDSSCEVQEAPLSFTATASCGSAKPSVVPNPGSIPATSIETVTSNRLSSNNILPEVQRCSSASLSKIIPNINVPASIRFVPRKELKMPTPNTLLKMLKLPPNVVYNMNSTTTTISKKSGSPLMPGTVIESSSHLSSKVMEDEKKSDEHLLAVEWTEEAPPQNMEFILPDSCQLEVFSPTAIKKEPVEDNSIDWIKKEIVESSDGDSESHEQDQITTSKEQSVEMMFECEEEESRSHVDHYEDTQWHKINQQAELCAEQQTGLFTEPFTELQPGLFTEPFTELQPGLSTEFSSETLITKVKSEPLTGENM